MCAMRFQMQMALLLFPFLLLFLLILLVLVSVLLLFVLLLLLRFAQKISGLAATRKNKTIENILEGSRITGLTTACNMLLN